LALALELSTGFDGVKKYDQPSSTAIEMTAAIKNRD
jgi:hypothetical protein